MKRIILSSLLTLASLVAISSCQKELDGPGKDVKSPGVKLVINAGTPEVKSFMEYDAANSQYLPKWHQNDALGVFIDSWEAGASAVNGTLANGLADGEKAQFSGNISADNGSHKAYAFYPARAYYASEDSKIVDLEIPYIQFPTANSFDPKADILVSVPKDFEVTEGTVSQMDMQFFRIGAILKVTLNDQTSVLPGDKIKSVKLETSNAVLTGAIRYDFENQAISSTPMVSTYSNKYVTADFSESPMALDNNAIFLVVNPVTLAAGSTLTVTVLTDKHEIVKPITIPSNITLTSGNLRPLKITLRNTDIIERVYFKDTFDWLYKYWDDLSDSNNSSFATAYLRSQTGQAETDPVSTSTSTHAQPNIWSKFSETVGKAFEESIGYVDMNKVGEVLYVEENYLKIGATAKQTAIQLPPIDFGNDPVNVTLNFKWCRHMAGSGNIDTVPLVVEVLNQGKCADTDAKTSEEFTTTQSKGSLLWTEASVVLKNVTNATRIVFKENFETYTVPGVHRFHLDDIKITEAAPTPVSFPVEWSFPKEGSVKGEDYSLNNTSGSFVYSDNHSGKLSVIRTSTQDANATDTKYPNTWQSKTAFTHYGVYKEDYWLFEVPNVKQSAGKYTIEYSVGSSQNGPKYFLVEYSVDNGTTWTAADNVKTFTYAESEGEIQYSYTIDEQNKWFTVTNTFSLGEITDFTTLRVRARVTSISRVVGTNMVENHGASNSIGDKVTISFEPNS